MCIVLQCIVIGVIISRYEYVLATGQTILVLTRWVDPRDLFRGDYVRIGYAQQLEEYTGKNYDIMLCSWSTSYTDNARKIYVVPTLSGDLFVAIGRVESTKPSNPPYITATLQYCDHVWVNATWDSKADRAFDTIENYWNEMIPYEDRVARLATKQGYKKQYVLHISYIPDRFFVTEWEGTVLEQQIRTGTVYAVWKIWHAGETVLSHLFVDGKIVR